ncbi:MAG: hypothetical protein MUP36_00440 [Demequinaceae bacterium]|nr:hypothetical protein [Demequinaceae bacterium]
MTEYDPKTGKLRPIWSVRFSPWMVFVGSFIGGAVAGGIIDLMLIPGENTPDAISSRTIGQAAILVLGMSILIFLLLGPALGWGLGFALRNVQNQSLHVLAFAALGLFVGFSVGEYLGRLGEVVGLGAQIAPAVGVGAAIGRWSISRYAKI